MHIVTHHGNLNQLCIKCTMFCQIKSIILVSLSQYQMVYIFMSPLAGDPVFVAWWSFLSWQKQCGDKGEKSAAGCEHSYPGLYGLQFQGVSFAECLCACVHVSVDRFDLFCVSTLLRTPVLERSNDTLKFHIPSGNKDAVSVCVVTADGRCHSKATVTYSSQPICSKLQPGVSWSR